MANGLVHGDSLRMLRALPRKPIFDLVITSPPYNLGKSYERVQLELDDYLEWQEKVIDEIVPRLRICGSGCWQIGNHIENGIIDPLDVCLHPQFINHNLTCPTPRIRLSCH